MLFLMKYLMAFTLLFLTACDKDEEGNKLCKGKAKYEFLQGNWVKDLGDYNGDSYKLRLNFDSPEKEKAWVTFGCKNNFGALAEETKEVIYIEHSPEQISLGYTGIMRPRDNKSNLECGSYSFGGKRFEVQFKGECAILIDDGVEHEFVKGL